ncbi:hypothetical protein CS006_08040 [Bifidobacterium primatium]|uniref:Uncharacterized protein n=1 Tax=Bifidobacterium primatium TaxID=2045438 RepID=A0A2M9H8R6_9BIFI|nr:hypothetical protein CS006_08040 [Bifidobacterium primatium]
MQLNVSIGSKLTSSWAKETIGTLPVGWRPAAPARSSYGRDGKNQMQVVVYADGKVAVENQGGSQTEQGGSLTVCYFAA